jgi:hypothetical protein
MTSLRFLGSGFALYGGLCQGLGDNVALCALFADEVVEIPLPLLIRRCLSAANPETSTAKFPGMLNSLN